MDRAFWNGLDLEQNGPTVFETYFLRAGWTGLARPHIKGGWGRPTPLPWDWVQNQGAGGVDPHPRVQYKRPCLILQVHYVPPLECNLNGLRPFVNDCSQQT